MKVAILTSGVAPVPATNGGAVENLIEHIINENEKYKKMKIDVYSIYENTSVSLSNNYNDTTFKYFKASFFSEWCDNIIYFFVKDVLKVEKNMKYRNILKRFEYIHKLKLDLDKSNYDKIILENHSTLFLALKGKKAKKFEGKYYMHLHNEIASLYKCDNIALKTKKIIGVSEYICNSALKTFKGYSKRNIDVLYNCVDIDKFNKKKYNNKLNELKLKYNINEDDIVVIFSGRLIKEKGIFELLKAIRLVKNTNIKLLVVGSYFYNTDMNSAKIEEIQNLSRDLREKIIFTGYVDYKNIAEIYAVADFAVLPSMWEEPAGLTVIEAMAMNLPVITTYSGGIPEYVNEECAILLKRDENIVINLAESIELLANNIKLREKMSNNSRKNALKYNIKDYYKNFIKVIEG